MQVKPRPNRCHVLHATLLDHVATCWAEHGGQTHATCCVQMLRWCCTNMLYPFGQGLRLKYGFCRSCSSHSESIEIWHTDSSYTCEKKSTHSFFIQAGEKLLTNVHQSLPPPPPPPTHTHTHTRWKPYGKKKQIHTTCMHVCLDNSPCLRNKKCRDNFSHQKSWLPNFRGFWVT